MTDDNEEKKDEKGQAFYESDRYYDLGILCTNPSAMCMCEPQAQTIGA